MNLTDWWSRGSEINSYLPINDIGLQLRADALMSDSRKLRRRSPHQKAGIEKKDQEGIVGSFFWRELSRPRPELRSPARVHFPFILNSKEMSFSSSQFLWKENICHKIIADIQGESSDGERGEDFTSQSYWKVSDRLRLRENPDYWDQQKGKSQTTLEYINKEQK